MLNHRKYFRMCFPEKGILPYNTEAKPVSEREVVSPLSALRGRAGSSGRFIYHLIRQRSLCSLCGSDIGIVTKVNLGECYSLVESQFCNTVNLMATECACGRWHWFLKSSHINDVTRTNDLTSSTNASLNYIKRTVGLLLNTFRQSFSPVSELIFLVCPTDFSILQTTQTLRGTFSL